MVEKVIKRDGREEPFIPEKIVVSAVKAGADRKDARDILEKVEDEAEKKIETKELKDKVLSHLEEKDPEWKENWETYDRAVKRR
ncbi:MAG: ATP cone domain-containing protein [Thermoplasmata archaeon]